MTGYTQSEEDYLEALYVIHQNNNVIRVKDVALAMDVTMPSVVTAIRSLAEKGLVNQEKYGHIELTECGEKVGKDVHDRHQLFYALLHEVFGLDPEIADEDACKMEHHLTPQTRERVFQMVEFVRACKQYDAHFLNRFMSFVKTGGMPGPCEGCMDCRVG